MNSYIYRIEEIIDSISDSIINIEKVIEQQSELIRVIERSDKRDYFEDFTKSLNEEIDKYTEQLETLEKKAQNYRNLLQLMKDDSDLDEFATVLFETLGIFGDSEK